MTQSIEGALAKRLSFATLCSYGSGQIGGQIFRDAPAALVPMFMATILGIPPWMAGVAILVPKLWMIICDPMMGALSDRYKAQHGRTPFLIVGGLVTSLGLVGLFTLPQFENPILAAIAISFVYFIASTGFSAYTVPYLALATEVSNDPYQRSRLMSARLMGGMIGGIAGVGLAQPMIRYFGSDALAWKLTLLILSGACLVTMLITALTMHNRVDRVAPQPNNVGIFQNIWNSLHDKEFRWLAVTFLLNSMAQACSFSVIAFLYLYCVGNVNLMLPYVLISSATVAISYPIWLRIAKHWSNAKCFTVGNIGFTILCITTFWIEPGNDVLVTLPWIGPVSTQQMIVLVRGAPQAFFSAGYILFTYSMFTDTVNRIAARDPKNANEGVYSGIFTATEKLAFAISPLIAGVVMSASGFVPSSGGAVDQSPQAVTGILVLYSLIPSAMHVLSQFAFQVHVKAATAHTLGANGENVAGIRTR